jgi:glutamate/tyrosine decarboxylase-like PLP-dependent enzyme
LVALLSAKARAVKKFKDDSPDSSTGDLSLFKNNLVAYTSSQANSSVERAGLLGDVTMRLLEPDEDLSLRGETLAKAIQEDLDKGLVPFFVVTTLGTTNCCSFDNAIEIGKVSQEFKIWMHIDAAYAGSAFICPEYRLVHLEFF